MTKRQTLASYVAKQPKPKRANAAKGQTLVRAALDALVTRGVFAWRNQSGVIRLESNGKSRFVHMSPEGSPDIFGVLHGGALFGIECKTGTGKCTESQRHWGELMQRRGAYWAEARTVGEVLSLINAWQVDADSRQVAR